MPTSPLPPGPASAADPEEHVIVRMARLLTSNLPENPADLWLIELMLAGAIHRYARLDQVPAWLAANRMWAPVIEQQKRSEAKRGG